jgi:RNA polymerase subunit RPABC4/transcription elongation factor Spt4
MNNQKISYLQFEQYLTEIASGVYPTIKRLFLENYGIAVTELHILGIVVNEEDKRCIQNRKIELEKKAQQEKKETIDRDDFIDTREHKKNVELRKLDIEEKAVEHHVKQDKEKKCPQCDFIVGENDKFCPECGFRLDLTCKKCGKKYPTQSKFCPYCGEKI